MSTRSRLMSMVLGALALALVLAGSATTSLAGLHRENKCNAAPYLPQGQDNCTRPCSADPCPDLGSQCVCPQQLPSNGCAGTYHRDCYQFTVANMTCYMATCTVDDEECPEGQFKCIWQQSTVMCGSIPSVTTCSQL